MKNNIEQLNNVVTTMTKNGLQPNETVVSCMEQLNNPELKIAFVGKFQTGKSHIINKLFLNGEQLLSEGHGLCMTAVTVAVRHGENRQLSYVNRTEEEVITIQDPEPEEIAPVIAAEKENLRITIAQTIDSVTLDYPNEALKHVTIYDTPGIDDPNPELLRETTYRLLPDADIIVLVVPPTTLSSTELRFLQKKIFAMGMNRFMILISQKPGSLLNDVGLSAIADEIKGQLAHIGKADIPIRLYREEDGIPCLNDGNDIASLILESATAFASTNRYSKAKRAIEKQLREEIYRLGLLNATYCKSQNERQAMKVEALRTLEDMRQALDDLQHDFNARMTLQRNQCNLGFQADVTEIGTTFIQKLNVAEGLAEAQQILNDADDVIGQQIEDAAVARMEQFQKGMLTSFQQLETHLRAHWKNETFDVLIEGVNGGRVQTWDATLLTVSDYIVSMFLLPGGWLMSMGLRFLLGKIPILRNITPTNLLKEHMVNVVRESLESQTQFVCADFKRTLERAQEKIIKALSAESEKEILRQKELLEVLDNQACRDDTAEEAREIQEQLQCVSDCLAQLA